MKIINLWRFFNMKKFKYLSLPGVQTSLMIILTLLLAFSFNSLAKEKKNGKSKQHRVIQKVTSAPSQSLIDVGNITSWVRTDGLHYWNVASSWNGAYPNGASAGAIFSEGIMWGGIVNDGQSPAVRVNGNTYQNGTAAMLSQVYRVRSDYLTADLTQDAADFFMESIGDVTPDQLKTIKEQYQKDWDNWPADQGAPYNDVNGDGKYDPSVDIPGIPGATQTLFIKYNDSNSNENYACIPIGLEISETYWAYSASGALGNIIFKKVDIVYTGTANSAADSKIDSMYIAQWADPDVGNSGDDFAGCDTALNLCYAYSSGYTDAVYQGLNLAPPAVGYDFLQGVSKYTGNPSDSAIFNLKWRHGYKYINPKPMSSSIYFASGGTWGDPEFDYNGGLEWYNMMRGNLPTQPYPIIAPFPAAVADVTPYGTYLLDGDPVFGSGKIDGAVDGPGDRRILAINGPITLSLHDTAEVVLAMVAGLGTSNISSISVMKYNDASAQYAYDQLFDIPLMPQPIVQAFGMDDKVVLNWGSPQNTIDEIENQDHGVYKFQGYAVYQLPPGGTDITKGVRIATFDLKDLTTVLYNKVLDEGTGLIISKPQIVLKNVGIQRFLTITQDQIFNKPLANGLPYTFAVTAMAYNNDPNLPANILESAPYIVTVTPQKPVPGTSYSQEGDMPSGNVTHTGTADASIGVKVISPDNVTGHKYEISFHNEMYSLGSDAKWTDVTTPLGKLGKISDLTGSNLVGSAGWTEKAGTFEIHYIVNITSPDYDYCDGIKLKLPSNIKIDSIVAPISSWAGNEIGYTYDSTTNTIMFGNIARDSAGVFGGGEDIMLISHTANLPITANYTMYDDGYGGNIVDVNGSDTIKAITKIIIQKQWDVKDLTTGNVVLKNQTIYNGMDIYASDYYYQQTGLYGPGGSSGSKTQDVNVTSNSIFDNSLQAAVTGSFNAPTTMADPAQCTVYLDGNKLSFSSSGYWHNSNFIFTDFTYFGYANGTVLASLGAYTNTYIGLPLSDVNDLQQDYELRWTGVVGDTTINGQTIQITKSGGQLVTLFGASSYDIKDDPLNPNQGSDAPFLVRVPFEIWNVDKNEQVNILFWDRSGDGSTSWNQNSREYLWVVNTKYDPSAPIDPAGSVVNDNATWNMVIYQSTFTQGDIIKISYANPLQIGVDKFTFDTKALTQSKTQAQADVSKVNVFPNPYYGYQYREASRNDHYVTFSHLPHSATIRIFDLSGVLVRTIRHVGLIGKDQFEQWNLQNDSGYPVASGIYIAYIDMGDLGTKILKLAIVQEQQILPVY